MDLKSIISKPNPTNSDLMSAITKLMDINNTEIKKSTDLIKHNLETAVTDIKAQIGHVTGRVTKIEEELVAATSQINTLNSDINLLKQKSIERDVIISGIPHSVVDHTDFLNRLSDILKFKLEDIELQYVKPITFKRSGRSGSGIINLMHMTFKNKTTKEEFMNTARRNGPLQAKQMYPQHGKQLITIREKLTPMNLEIFKKLLLLKKAKKISHCWFRHNNIYIKITPNEAEKPLTIRSLNDVMKLEQQ